ncbi:MAG: hypothetical protein Q4D13_04135 [Erysipelotrichaceae bacterium]|nr:hypothetical protein [Erysipelotrichaceae bacterium]
MSVKVKNKRKNSAGNANTKLVRIFLILLLLVCGTLAYYQAFIKPYYDTAELEPEEEIIVLPDPVEHAKVYLAVGEYYTLDNSDYVSEDGSIALVTNGRVKGISNGVTTLSDGISIYDIEVTDMITAPYISTDKEQLPCNYYSVEENEYLDEVLAGKVAEKGYGTRAGAVEAARFLVLQFPWHMSYFSENGRLYPTGPTCEGEGRYYHEGLYLNIYKAEEFVAVINGPQPWGCAFLSNPAGINQINSLDCAGFVSWALVNGGFDPNDMGAGPDDENYDYSDIGPQYEITYESLDEVKVGDLFAEDGHISILIGIKDGYYYIAESNLYIDIRVRVSTKEELINSDFYAWIDMDEFYNYQDGKLTDYWEE